MQCTTIRPARRRECGTIARLFQISSDGVADYIWGTYDCPGLSLLEIGSQRYARDNTDFSYENCLLAEIDGRVAGMLHAFALPEAPAVEAEPEAPSAPSGPEESAVLRPYGELELPGSFYISGLALFPEYRGRGIGSLLLQHAHMRAESQGLPAASLLCFEQNRAALRFYLRHRYRVLDRRKVVPHPLIHYEGDALLMARDLNPGEFAAVEEDRSLRSSARRLGGAA